MMNQHQSIKAEIDSRDDSFTQCFNLGKEMLSKDHYASEEVSQFEGVFSQSDIRVVDYFREGMGRRVYSLWCRYEPQH